MKKIAILGSTGSIGTQCLDIIRENKEQYKVAALTCGTNTELIARQIEEFNPELAVTGTEKDAQELQKRFPHMEIMYGDDGLQTAAAAECDMVVNALVGMRETAADIRCHNGRQGYSSCQQRNAGRRRRDHNGQGKGKRRQAPSGGQ